MTNREAFKARREVKVKRSNRRVRVEHKNKLKKGNVPAGWHVVMTILGKSDHVCMDADEATRVARLLKTYAKNLPKNSN
jgi:hypothetical protein